jgi:hypothetical protein
MAMRPYPERRTTERTPTLRRLIEPWTLILIATGLFQFFRGAPVDAAFFLVVAFLLIADAAGILWFAGTGLPRPGLIVVASIVLGLLLLLVPRHGAAAGIIVGAAGIGLLALAWSPSGPPSAVRSQAARSQVARSQVARSQAARPQVARPQSAQPGSPAARATAPRVTAISRPGISRSGISRSALVWIAIAIAGCLLEVATYLLGLPSPAAKVEHPSISILLDPVLDTQVGRIGFVAVWLIVLVWLLRRTGAR